MRPPAPFFERLLDIHKQELGRVLLMSAYLLLVIASYTTTKAVRDSLFVTNIGPAQLPYMYLVIAGAMGLVSLVYSNAVHRIGLHRLIQVTSLAAISNLLLFWLLFKHQTPIWFYVLYVWVSLFGAITGSQSWLLATHVFHPREARRVFTWIGVGGILGGILGGGLTNRMAGWFGTESLLIACATMMAVTLVLLGRVTKFATTDSGEAVRAAPAEENERTGAGELFHQVRQSRHLTMMVLLLSAAVIVEAFIDYEYKFVAKQSFSSKDQLTAFFGSITFYIGIFSLLFQMLATNRILKRFGVGWAILILPAGLLVAFVALAIRPVLWAAAVLQLVDGGFSYSIHRSGMELLYLPIPPQTRNAVKGFIDMFVDRTGRAMGALLLLLLTAVLTLSIASLSVIAGGLAIAWIAMAIAIKRQYVHSFREALEKKTIEPGALQLRNLDSETLKTLLALLASDDERQIIYALDLLSNTHPNRWRNHINILIRHRSRAVRARTIAVLSRWNDASITREEFVHHPDYETARIATASALRLYWTGSRRDRQLLSELLPDSSLEVARQAILTCGIVKYEEALPILIERLADKRLRRDARDALSKFGARVIPELVRRLLDNRERDAIRLSIPKTLALTGQQQAADVLIENLHRLDYRLDYAVMKALNRMRVNFSGIEIDSGRMNSAIAEEREAYDRLQSVRAWLQENPDEDPVFSLLIRAVTERLEQRLERIFRLVGLIYSPHDIYSVYYNCQIKPALRQSAIEFLDNQGAAIN